MKLQAAGVTRISESGATEITRKRTIDRSMSHASIPLLRKHRAPRFANSYDNTKTGESTANPQSATDYEPANYCFSFEYIIYF